MNSIVPQKAFSERLSERLGREAEDMPAIGIYLNGIQSALRRHFPLCHVDTNDIEETLLMVAEQAASLRRRTRDAVPELPHVEMPRLEKEDAAPEGLAGDVIESDPEPADNQTANGPEPAGDLKASGPAAITIPE